MYGIILNSWITHEMTCQTKVMRAVGCLENPFPSQRPVTQSFDILFDLRLNKRLSKQSWGWWFETLSRPLWRHSHVSSLSPKTNPKERAFEIITTKNQKCLISKSTLSLLMGISYSAATDSDPHIGTNQQFTGWLFHLPFFTCSFTRQYKRQARYELHIPIIDQRA